MRLSYSTITASLCCFLATLLLLVVSVAFGVAYTVRTEPTCASSPAEYTIVEHGSEAGELEWGPFEVKNRAACRSHLM